MSASRTFTPMTANTDLVTISPYINASKFGYQDAEWARQDIDILSYLAGHLDLGGDERPMTITTPATWQSVNGARSYDLNGDTLGGLTLEVVLFYYSSNAATTVDVRLRNTTDSSNAATLAAPSAATTVTRTARTVTLASGIKTYILQWDASNTTNPVYAWGYLRLRKVPA